MALLLRNRDIRGLMDLGEYIDAVDDGYRDFGSGAGAAKGRRHRI